MAERLRSLEAQLDPCPLCHKQPEVYEHRRGPLPGAGTVGRMPQTTVRCGTRGCDNSKKVFKLADWPPAPDEAE